MVLFLLVKNSKSSLFNIIVNSLDMIYYDCKLILKSPLRRIELKILYCIVFSDFLCTSRGAEECNVEPGPSSSVRRRPGTEHVLGA